MRADFPIRPYLLDLRQLYYFVKVAEIGSFTKASTELNIVQPALGVSIRKLEELLQIVLLDRHSRGVTLTEHGHVLFDQAIGLLDHAVQVQHAMTTLRQDCPERLVIGLSPSMAPVSAMLLRKHTGLNDGTVLRVVEAETADLVTGLTEGQIDMACLYGEGVSRADIKSELIRSEDMLVVGTAETIQSDEEEMPFAELANLPLAIYRARLLGRLESRANTLGIQLRLLPGLVSDNLCLELAMTSGACTILPKSLVQAKIDAGLLRGARIVQPRLTTRLFLCCRHEAEESTLGKLIKVWLTEDEQEDISLPGTDPD